MKTVLAVLFAALVLGADPAPDSLPRGRELAQIYCQVCHLFPDPSLLDKNSWASGALRRMAPHLGAAKVNYDARPDGAILKEAGVFPNAPLISEEDWRALCQFYTDAAPERPLPLAARPAIAQKLQGFSVRRLDYPGAKAMVTLVQIDPARKLLYVGNGGDNCLDIVTLDGERRARIPLDSPPTSLTHRPDGMYVTLIGNIFPSDEKNGRLVRISMTGDSFHVATLLEGLQRPTSAEFLDINEDGREDIVLCAFGNYLGRFSWFEKLASGKYQEHPLLEQPGAVNSIARRSDAGADILVLFAQAKESLHRFVLPRAQPLNTRHEVLAEFHPAFGFTHFELADMNQDGREDILITNGDNGDYPSLPKAYHAIRILLQDEKGSFSETWRFPMNGAFKAVAADFDADGDKDIAAISFFPDYRNSPEESFILLENNGQLRFSASSFPQAPLGRWLVMDAADADADGDTDIVLGSFANGPASVPIPPDLRAHWTTKGPAVMFLKNTSKQP